MHREESLIAGMQRGDVAAQEELITKYYDEIYVFAYRQTGEKQLAMDLTQDIFLSVLQTVGHYKKEKAGFRTWLYRVATNKVIDYRRKRKLVVVNLLELQVEEDLKLQLEEKGFLAEVEAYISKQSREKQRTLRLYLYAGYTFAEIAALGGESESTVKTRYYRFLAQIRREFGDEANTHAK